MTPRGSGPLLRAGLLGFLAAIVGAAIYYGVIAITNLEIGIVAILIGFMVGYAVRKGASGYGGRRFQIMAVVLTYWSVGLAYTPLAFKGMTDAPRAKAAASRPADSTSAASSAARDSSASSATGDFTDSVRAGDTASVRGAAQTRAGASSGKSLAIALATVIALVFALPIISIVGSMPSGLISAFIIFIGLRQAWHMTGAPKLAISGPYRIGAEPERVAG